MIICRKNYTALSFLIGIIIGVFTTYAYCNKVCTTDTQSNTYALQMRKSNYAIDSLFLKRWSPRAMSGESLTDEELMMLFEAARWAPSSYNDQPWRFIYAKRNTPAWDTLFNLMVPFNQEWTKNAAALVVIVSRNNFESGSPSPTHSFDTGSAFENLALQAAVSGLVVHGMGGFDYARAKEILHIPDNFTVEAMVAVGKPGNLHDLPESLQAHEMPSNRKPLNEIVFEGSFKEEKPSTLAQ